MKPSYLADIFHQSEEITEIELEPCSSDSTASSGDAFSARHTHNVADERPLPALLKKQTNNSSVEEAPCPEENDQSSKLNDENQCLPEATVRLASVAIDVVGLPLVS